MLTPAMRAIFLLALPLLVPRVLADHEDPPVTADDLALLAHRLDRRSYLHDPFRIWSRRGGSGDRAGHRYHAPGAHVCASHPPRAERDKAEYQTAPTRHEHARSRPLDRSARLLRRHPAGLRRHPGGGGGRRPTARPRGVVLAAGERRAGRPARATVSVQYGPLDDRVERKRRLP